MKKQINPHSKCPECNGSITKTEIECHPILNKIKCQSCNMEFTEQGRIFSEGLRYFISKKTKLS